jgi:hypothetical protein
MPSNFLNAPGTNGFISAISDQQTTELNSLAAGAAAISTNIFTQSTFNSAAWLSLWFESGGTFTPTAGQCLYGWFLISPDGTTFDSPVSTPSTTVFALSRAPDFIIALDNAAFSATNIRWCQGRFIKAPWESYKLMIQNIGSASPTALPSSGNKIRAAGVALQL